MSQAFNKHVKIGVPYKVKARKVGFYDLYEDMFITKDGEKSFNYSMEEYEGVYCDMTFTPQMKTIDTSSLTLPWRFDYNNTFKNNLTSLTPYNKFLDISEVNIIPSQLPSTMTSENAWVISNGVLQNGSKSVNVNNGISIGYFEYTPTTNSLLTVNGKISSEPSFDYGGVFVGKTLWTPTDQPGNKWNNSCINWKTACENKNISEDFVLMNDDFFALHPIRDWKSSLNVCLGSFDDEARKYKHTKFSKWQGGFVFGTELLDSLKCSTRYNFESHIPMVINKKNYLNMLKLPEIQEYMKTNKVLHKRTMYKNLYPDFEYSLPKKIRDVKVRLNCDLLSLWLEEDWLSVFDNVVGNVSSYPKLNIFLDSMFPNKCRFEI